MILRFTHSIFLKEEKRKVPQGVTDNSLHHNQFLFFCLTRWGSSRSLSIEFQVLPLSDLWSNFHDIYALVLRFLIAHLWVTESEGQAVYNLDYGDILEFLAIKKLTWSALQLSLTYFPAELSSSHTK